MTELHVRRLVVISDFQDGDWADTEAPAVEWFTHEWLAETRGGAPVAANASSVEVEGGYLERLPLAALSTGLVDCIEIWTHWRGDRPPLIPPYVSPHIVRRSFRLNGKAIPFSSNDMLGHINAFGAPTILCVWGLGVAEEILCACHKSFKIYNSIDAPPLRVPPAVSRHFDLILTGAEWQSDAVLLRHPQMQTAVMPIGPEFASEITFHPMDVSKIYDIIYVAAAQAYKRHDILFEALRTLPRTIRTLCVCGYGELIDDLRRMAGEHQLNIDFVGPPGVSYSEVNRMMNQARMGVVCGIDDGAPAVLTEYMLAGIPVLANSELKCGLQYILPTTGRTASADEFAFAISGMLDSLDTFSPRDVALSRWTWRHSIGKLRSILEK
ncbi:glycosyltransferase [Rhizobium cauense]|uniref:glycosyltransferase n=1 Tax=Rhizobium cauense TaxID=1166683 RepID=UPI001C6E6C2B|nr:glycosyltransferase [Rhizobium cauense]MBW9115590.1 glycosyltransferase [Rhizobium cauense]